jgi:hypothetical protein
MNSHLTPEQRPDKNGHVVTRHVRTDKGQNAPSEKLAALSAPTLSTSTNVVSYTRAASPFDSSPHNPGHFTKVALSSTGKRMHMSLRDIPEGADPDELSVNSAPTFEEELTDGEREEFDQCANVFAHEAAAMAHSTENIAIPAEMIPDGAYVDFNGCAYISRDDWNDHSFEYAEVEEVEKNGDEVILHTSQGSIPLPADYALPVYSKRLNEITPVYSNSQINEAADAAIAVALEEARHYDWEDEDTDIDAFDIDNITDDTRKKFRDLITKFTKGNPWAVEASGLSPEELGSDFYMTASGQGVGYTDRENIPTAAANELTAAISRTTGLSIEGSSMYLGDDGIPYWGA